MDKEFEKVFLNKDIFLYSENNNMFVENKITLFFIILFFLDNLFYFEIIKNLILEATSKLENNRSIQNELDSLFKTQLDIETKKYGNSIKLEISLTFINPIFVYDNNEEYIKKIIFLLLKIVFCMRFDVYDLEMAKNMLVEELDYNLQMLDILNISKFKAILGEVVKKDEIINKIEILTYQQVWDFYNCLLENKIVEMIHIGSASLSEISGYIDIFFQNKIRNCKNVQKNNHFLVSNYKFDKPLLVLQEDRIILEYKTPHFTCLKDIFCIWLFALIWGGTPFSKLAINLRDKMGVCYSCSVDYDLFSDFIFVECAFVNIEENELKNIIEKYLVEVQEGNFTEQEFVQAKEFLKNCINNYKIDPDSLERWFNIKYFTGENASIKEVQKIIDDVSAKEMLERIKELTLETIYFPQRDINNS